MVKLTLPNPKDLARRWPPGRSQPQPAEDAVDEGAAEPAAEPKPPPPLPRFSCCPTWRTTARCGWTG